MHPRCPDSAGAGEPDGAGDDAIPNLANSGGRPITGRDYRVLGLGRGERELAAGDRIMERAFCAAPADASAIGMPVNVWVDGARRVRRSDRPNVTGERRPRHQIGSSDRVRC